MQAEDGNPSRRFELAGTIGYAYSKSTFEQLISGEQFHRYFGDHTFSVQPSIGYFGVGGLETFLDIRYSYNLSMANEGDYDSNNPSAAPTEVEYSY